MPDNTRKQTEISEGIKDLIFENPSCLEIKSIANKDDIFSIQIAPRFVEIKVHSKKCLVKLDEQNNIENIITP